MRVVLLPTQLSLMGLFFSVDVDTTLSHQKNRFMGALASKPDLLLVFGAVVVWNGALTSAYAMWAQTRGQASVAPSEVRRTTILLR